MREWVVHSEIQYQTGQGVSGCCEAVETRFDRSNIGETFSTARSIAEAAQPAAVGSDNLHKRTGLRLTCRGDNGEGCAFRAVLSRRAV